MNGNAVFQPAEGPPPEDELKDKNLGDIISETFRIYFAGFLNFMALVVIGQGILYITQYIWILPSMDTVDVGPWQGISPGTAK